MGWREFSLKAISVPFAEHGRGYDGWDCWGLVTRGYEDVLGVALPDYHEAYGDTRQFRRLERAFAARPECFWKRAKNPRPGAVALMRRRSLLIHVGLLMDGGTILHCEERTDTTLERASAMKVEGYYEYTAA